MAQTDAEKLAAFLEREYMKRLNAQGRGYTLTQFAADLSMAPSVLNRLMNVTDTTRERSISLETLQKLVGVFGADVLQLFGLWPG